MNKKLIALIAAGALAATLGLAGCGGSQPASSSAASSSAAASHSASASASAKASASAAAAQSAPAATKSAAASSASAAASASAATTPEVPGNSFISEDEAQRIAVADAGLNLTDCRTLQAVLDRQSDPAIFAVVFTTETTGYSYDIDAVTGTILNSYSETIGSNDVATEAKADAEGAAADAEAATEATEGEE